MACSSLLFAYIVIEAVKFRKCIMSLQQARLLPSKHAFNVIVRILFLAPGFFCIALLILWQRAKNMQKHQPYVWKTTNKYNLMNGIFCPPCSVWVIAYLCVLFYVLLMYQTLDKLLSVDYFLLDNKEWYCILYDVPFH